MSVAVLGPDWLWPITKEGLNEWKMQIPPFKCFTEPQTHPLNLGLLICCQHHKLGLTVRSVEITTGWPSKTLKGFSVIKTCWIKKRMRNWRQESMCEDILQQLLKQPAELRAICRDCETIFKENPLCIIINSAIQHLIMKTLLWKQKPKSNGCYERRAVWKVNERKKIKESNSINCKPGWKWQEAPSQSLYWIHM